MMKEGRFVLDGTAIEYPSLEIMECEGHGRYFEVLEHGEYVGTFDKPDGREVRWPDPPGPTLGERFGGRLAAVYGFDAYERACEARAHEDPEGYDFSDVVPDPVLAVVRREAKA